ncbi:MAG: ATP-dependent protease subunit HslV [Armatimonadota bacterium]
MERQEIIGTTVVAVRRDGRTAMAGDGQVTMGDTVLKGGARKVRRIGDGRVLVGFAGSVADACNLTEVFERKLVECKGVVRDACITFATLWRTDRVLRHLEALMIVADTADLFLLAGDGNVVEPDDAILAIGSGANYARAAAMALVAHTQLQAREVAEESLKIAAAICIYTNDRIVVEELP